MGEIKGLKKGTELFRCSAIVPQVVFYLHKSIIHVRTTGFIYTFLSYLRVPSRNGLIKTQQTTKGETMFTIVLPLPKKKRSTHQ